MTITINAINQKLQLKPSSTGSLKQNASLRFGGTDPNASSLTTEQQTNILELLGRLQTLVTGGLRQGDLKANTKLVEGAAATLKNLPQGSFQLENGHYLIDPFDGQEPVTIPATRKVFGPGTNIETFLTESFGEKPKLVICPVGWTVPDPDNVASLNPEILKKFEARKQKAADTTGESSGPKFDKAYTKEKKEVLKKYYEAAFKQWWTPVQKELMTLIKRNGYTAGEVCFLTSASYDGIDKAAIDFAETAGMKVANITPYTYARWMKTDSKHPLLVTNTIGDYADACSAADVVLVTGGREHTLGQDIYRGLIGKKAKVIVADILNEELGITVPAYKGGDIENAAAYMLKQGFRVANMDLANHAIQIPGLRDTQLATVAVLDKLFSQLNIA